MLMLMLVMLVGKIGDGAGNDFGGGAGGVGDHSVGDNDASDAGDSGTGNERRKFRSYTSALWSLKCRYV